MSICLVRGLAATIVLALFTFPASAQRAPLFKSEILPVLQKNCVSCHGDQKKMAGLDLSSFAGLMAGGSSGPAIAPGKPERSLLWQLIDTGKMPMGGKLTGADKQLIRTYIEQGRFPSMEAAQQEREAAKITPEARNWWSFRKPADSPVPAVKNKDQVKTPIDAFVLSKLEAKGWKMQPEANRVTLIRRAYLDLTGLPPASADVQAFVEDKSPKAYEKVVDRLLASPHYGEQWGRHWLDVAGYSDSVGDAYDTERVASWKYRDYAINAFNKNKPYNRFLMEQFAGDQLVNYDPGARPTPEQIEPLTATGFLRTTADITDNQTIYQVDKYFDALEKATETSLKAVMGLTVQCARCHDHKFDPILQRDYYKLTAAFQAAYDPENWLAANLHYGEWPSRVVLDMAADQRDTWIQAVTSDTAKQRRREELLFRTRRRTASRRLSWRSASLNWLRRRPRFRPCGTKAALRKWSRITSWRHGTSPKLRRRHISCSVAIISRRAPPWSRESQRFSMTRNIRCSSPIRSSIRNGATRAGV
jgi:cytochrome c553